MDIVSDDPAAAVPPPTPRSGPHLGRVGCCCQLSRWRRYCAEQAPRARFKDKPDRVFLDRGAATDQQTAVESALSRVYPPERIHRQNREQTLESLREDYLKEFDAQTAAGVGESFRVELPGSSIDCTALDPIGDMPGVSLITVGQPANDNRPNALLTQCP